MEERNLAISNRQMALVFTRLYHCGVATGNILVIIIITIIYLFYFYFFNNKHKYTKSITMTIVTILAKTSNVFVTTITIIITNS